MTDLEVFCDYVCPFCYKGYGFLKELSPQHADINVIWRLCEVHPRPERAGMHSDLCIQGLHFAMEQDVDVWEYHNRMFRAALIDRSNIEDPNVLTGYVTDLLDPDAFLATLRSGKYEKAVSDANDYAYDWSGVWFLPAYRMGGKKLDAVGGVGVTKEQLAQFLDAAG